MTYSVAWASLHFIVYISALCLLLSLTVVGLVCMLDASESVSSLGQAVTTSFDYLLQRLNQIGPNIFELSPTAYVLADTVNHRLDGISAVNMTSRLFYQSLVTANGHIQSLQFSVEGCKAAVSSCHPEQDPTSWNQCVNGRHSVGKGAVLSSGATNPACRDANGLSKACPCCANCTLARSRLADAEGRVPSNFDAFNKRISHAEIDRYFQDAVDSANNLIRPFQSSLRDAQGSVNSFFSSVDDKKSLRTGVIFAIWAPGWLIVAMALLGLCLAPYSDPSACAPRSPLAHPGKLGHCLHWTALVLGVLWVSLVTLPAFAALSVVSLPSSDLCRLLPLPGDDPTDFVRVFVEGSGVASASNVSDLIRRCVLAPGGSLADASLAGSVDRAFDPLRVSKSRISNQTVGQYLSAQSQSAPFEQAQGPRPPPPVTGVACRPFDSSPPGPAPRLTRAAPHARRAGSVDEERRRLDRGLRRPPELQQPPLVHVRAGFRHLSGECRPSQPRLSLGSPSLDPAQRDSSSFRLFRPLRLPEEFFFVSAFPIGFGCSDCPVSAGPCPQIGSVLTPDRRATSRPASTASAPPQARPPLAAVRMPLLPPRSGPSRRVGGGSTQ